MLEGNIPLEKNYLAQIEVELEKYKMEYVGIKRDTGLLAVRYRLAWVEALDGIVREIKTVAVTGNDIDSCMQSFKKQLYNNEHGLL